MDVPPSPESAHKAASPAQEAPLDARSVESGHATTVEALIRQIEAEFPGWGVWRSDTLRWWAFRTAANPLTIDQLRAGCRLIVQADTDAQLRTAIRAEIEGPYPGLE